MKHILILPLVFFSLQALAAADGSAYKGKVMFIKNKRHASKCFPVGPRTLQMLSEYDNCADAKGEAGPLQKSVAKCDKADGSIGYIFESADDCSGAQSDVADTQ